MKYTIVSLFPEFFKSPLENSLLDKAIKKGLLDFNFINPRDFALDPHKTVDDTPYGGGVGMLMMLPPLIDALESIETQGRKVRFLALSPDGTPLTQAKVKEYAKEEELVLICGRYEGFDSRLFDILPIEKVSVGDYVLNGGETGALTLIEATARLQNGFMGKNSSSEEESFSNNLLEYPHYTRPEEFRGHKVPAVLLNGNHKNIKVFRHEASLKKTLEYRPDLFKENIFSTSDIDYVRNQTWQKLSKNLYIALLHHPVILKDKSIGTSSLTNLDIHDISRSSCTYNIAGFYVVTPIKDQQNLLSVLTGYWTHGSGSTSNKDRQEALSLVSCTSTLEEAVACITKETNVPPYIIGTSARILQDKKKRDLLLPTSYLQVKEMLKEKPLLLLFGTSHGIAPELLMQCHGILPPLRAFQSYNHLSVRAAVAIYLDRLLGEMG